MQTSIRTNYLFTYLILALSTVLLVRYYGHSLLLENLTEEKETFLYKEANFIAQEYIPDIESLTAAQDKPASQLRDYFESLRTAADIRFWVTDSTGLILIDSSPEENQEGTDVSLYDNDFLSYQTYTGQLPGNLAPGRILAVVYPLASNQKTIGYLVLMASVDSLRQTADNYMNDITFFLFLLFSLIFFAFLFLARRTAKQIKNMITAIREYANGHFDYSMEKVSGREYKEFAAAIRYLADKMKNMNDYQTKFIANISHDFRSPLTSVKGYTEAMLDGTIPPEMQEKYLTVILFETERLSKLTGNLLELSQFENNGIPLELSTFDINRILKITTLAFQQQCTVKKISIRLVFSKKVLLVDADENKIEQVIQNLIDNAVKFSPPDSTIEIHTMEQMGKAFISIKDHGIGIPKKSLPHIWDRFYKSDFSRGRDKTGTGLGLSITKEILEAHNEHINAISTVGVGTEFTFTLKAHS